MSGTHQRAWMKGRSSLRFTPADTAQASPDYRIMCHVIPCHIK